MALLQKEIFRNTYVDTDLLLVEDKTTTSDELGNAAGIDVSKIKEVPLVWNLRVVTSDDSDADETYLIELRSATDVGISTAIKVEESIIVTRGDANKLFQRRVAINQDFTMTFADVGGTTPSIKYTSWLSPDR